jgi:hypothetical protein
VVITHPSHGWGRRFDPGRKQGQILALLWDALPAALLVYLVLDLPGCNFLCLASPNINSNFPNISIASINCNSLNMSSLGSANHLLKIHGITSLRSDIVLLSDIRLCNTAGVSNSSELKNSFRTNPYESYNFLSNSRKNSWGVGVLLKTSLNFAVEDEYRDADDNILGLRLNIDGKTFAICAIYGPNQVQPAFFANLRICIQQLNWILP